MWFGFILSLWELFSFSYFYTKKNPRSRHKLINYANSVPIRVEQIQEYITRSVYLTHDNVLGLWVNRFAWINWIPRDSMGSMCLIRKTPAFFSAWETEIQKINMAEADLSPTTFTSSSASDSDYDISLRIPLKMKTKIYTLSLPDIIIIRPRKQCKA